MPPRPQRKLAHWRAIAIAACEQCGRNRPPGVVGPVALADFLRSDLTSGTRLLLEPGSGAAASSMCRARRTR